MGLWFLRAWIASGLTKVGVALGHFLATVWDANGNSSIIDKGARQLADGIAQLIELILEGIVAYAATKGPGKALEMLGNSWFGKQLGPARLEQWLKQQLKARDTGGGSAGEVITPDGQRMPIHGETPQHSQPSRIQGESGGSLNQSQGTEKIIIRAKKLTDKIIEKAREGKLKRAANYHGRLPSNVEELILSQPEQVYLSTGKSQRFIFLKNENVVITEGPGSSAGNIITSYGPDGPRGESGAAIFGGSKNDPGLPISHDMIVKGEIPTPGGDTMMPGIPILK